MRLVACVDSGFTKHGTRAESAAQVQPRYEVYEAWTHASLLKIGNLSISSNVGSGP